MPLDNVPRSGPDRNTNWERIRAEARYTFGTVLKQRCPSLVPTAFSGNMAVVGISNPDLAYEWEWLSDDASVDAERKFIARRVAELARENFGKAPPSAITEKLKGKGTVIVLAEFDAIFVIVASCGTLLLDAAFLHILLRVGGALDVLDRMARQMGNPYWQFLREI